MTSYRTLTINGILAPPKARMIYFDLLANVNPDLPWVSVPDGLTTFPSQPRRIPCSSGRVWRGLSLSALAF